MSGSFTNFATEADNKVGNVRLRPDAFMQATRIPLPYNGETTYMDFLSDAALRRMSEFGECYSKTARERHAPKKQPGQ